MNDQHLASEDKRADERVTGVVCTGGLGLGVNGWTWGGYTARGAVNKQSGETADLRQVACRKAYE